MKARQEANIEEELGPVFEQTEVEPWNKFKKILQEPPSVFSCELDFSFNGGECEIKIIRDGDVVGEIGIGIDSDGEIRVLCDTLGLEEYEDAD